VEAPRPRQTPPRAAALAAGAVASCTPRPPRWRWPRALRLRDGEASSRA
jgi:hypothetical protein